jgi:hypothetical protein
MGKGQEDVVKRGCILCSASLETEHGSVRAEQELAKGPSGLACTLLSLNDDAGSVLIPTSFQDSPVPTWPSQCVPAAGATCTQ